MSENAREYDIVVFGATGFTGKQVAIHLARKRPDGKRWAVAGRNAERLRVNVCMILDEMAKTEGWENYSPPAVLVADTDVRPRCCHTSFCRCCHPLLLSLQDPASLEAMSSQARLLLNCTGPYRFLGEPVVQVSVCTDIPFYPV